MLANSLFIELSFLAELLVNVLFTIFLIVFLKPTLEFLRGLRDPDRLGDAAFWLRSSS